MVGSNISSGLGRGAFCETLESRNFFSSSVGPAVGVDPGFRGGVVQTRFGGVDESANDVIVLKDGRALAVGSSRGSAFGDHDRVVVAVYNTDGTLSNRFDGDGKLVLSQAASDKLRIQLVEQAKDGGVLLLGDAVTLKLKLDGSVDTAFGKAGFAPRLTTSQYDNGREFQQLADGTLRDVTYDAGVLRIQDESAAGKVVKSLRRTIGAGDGSVGVDATGITVLAGKKVYRFSTADLSKISGFGKGGVVDLDPYYQTWASAHGPWHYAYDDDNPIAGNPDYDAQRIVDAKSGVLILGDTDGLSSTVPYVYPPGLGDPYTPLSFAISANGKSVAVDGGPVKGTLLAHTQYAAYPGTGEDGYDFGGTFTKINGDTRYFSANLSDFDEIQTSDYAAQAADGSFYVAGEVNVSDGPADHGGYFTIAHTMIV